MQYVEPKFQDIYPLHYPKFIMEKYSEIRAEAKEKALNKLIESRGIKDDEKMRMIPQLSSQGYTPEEISEILKIPLETIYGAMKKR
jgi:SOS response regulatory protein OraA/RecX